MDDAPFVPLGRVVKVHGVKGEVSVAFVAGPPFLLPEDIEVWVVPPTAGPKAYRIEGIRSGPKGPLVKLSQIGDRGSAESLRGRTLMVRREDLPAGLANELPLDMTDMQVVDADRGFLGRIVDTIVTGANDVWVVEGGPVGQVLIPVIDDVVVGIDEELGQVDIRLLPGLIAEEDA